MLIGADVHHKKGNTSIIGFCATMNSTFSSYYSRATQQNKGYFYKIYFSKIVFLIKEYDEIML